MALESTRRGFLGGAATLAAAAVIGLGERLRSWRRARAGEPEDFEQSGPIFPPDPDHGMRWTLRAEYLGNPPWTRYAYDGELCAWLPLRADDQDRCLGAVF